MGEQPGTTTTYCSNDGINLAFNYERRLNTHIHMSHRSVRAQASPYLFGRLKIVNHRRCWSLPGVAAPSRCNDKRQLATNRTAASNMSPQITPS